MHSDHSVLYLNSIVIIACIYFCYYVVRKQRHAIPSSSTILEMDRIEVTSYSHSHSRSIIIILIRISNCSNNALTMA